MFKVNSLTSEEFPVLNQVVLTELSSIHENGQRISFLCSRCFKKTYYEGVVSQWYSPVGWSWREHVCHAKGCKNKCKYKIILHKMNTTEFIKCLKQ